MDKENVLRIATYMCPSIPVEYYEMICGYLEEKLNLQTTLIYDSRRNSPQKSREDHKRIDIGNYEFRY